MRFAAACLVPFLLADATPKGGDFRETLWSPGDFVAIANQPLDRLVESGHAVGLQISGQGESCLLRRRTYPLRLPCRLKFRVRWTDAKFDHAFPTVHVVFDPPPTTADWWKHPTTHNGSHWGDGRQTFLFHFATRPDFRRIGMTSELESAHGRHGYCSEKGARIDLEIRLDARTTAVFADGRKVAECEADLRGFKSFTYGIGDQTSTFVELDEFCCVEGR